MRASRTTEKKILYTDLWDLSLRLCVCVLTFLWLKSYAAAPVTLSLSGMRTGAKTCTEGKSLLLYFRFLFVCCLVTRTNLIGIRASGLADDSESCLRTLSTTGSRVNLLLCGLDSQKTKWYGPSRSDFSKRSKT